MEELKPYIEGKHIIMLRSDRADTEKYIETKLLKELILHHLQL